MNCVAFSLCLHELHFHATRASASNTSWGWRPGPGSSHLQEILNARLTELAAALCSGQCLWQRLGAWRLFPTLKLEALSEPRARPQLPLEAKGEGGATFESR